MKEVHTLARPKQSRRIAFVPEVNYYKPEGVPSSSLQDVVLTVDELEAMRLADFEGLYQKGAAEKMNVSRQTFGRILGSAREKVVAALLSGKALRIEGGEVELVTVRKYACGDCGRSFEMPHGAEGSLSCISCRSPNVASLPESRRKSGRKRRERWGPVSVPSDRKAREQS